MAPFLSIGSLLFPHFGLRQQQGQPSGLMQLQELIKL